MMEEVALDAIQLYGTGTSANLTLKDFKGLGNPAPRANRNDRARRHGALDLTTYYTSRTWTGEMWIMADGTDPADWANFWTAYDVFMGALDYGVPTKELIFKRKGLAYEEFSSVTIDEEMEPEFPSPGQPICRVPFSLVSADPRLYGLTLNTTTFTTTGTAVNGGNFGTSPLIRFNGAGTNPGLRNDALSTENVVQCTYVMGGGDEIEVDCLARTVKLNGVLRPDILAAGSSFFWGLVAGSNGMTKLGGAASVDVEWHDARIA